MALSLQDIKQKQGNRQGKSFADIRNPQASQPTPPQKNTSFSMFGMDRNTTAGKIANFLPDIGVGIGTTIGKAGLGLGEAALKTARFLGVDSATPAIEQIQNIKQGVYDRPYQNVQGLGRGTGNVIGTAATYLAPSRYVTGAQGTIARGINALPGAGTGARFAKGFGNALAGALPEAVGAGFSGTALSGGDMSQVKRDALIGGGVSAGFRTLGAGYRGLKDTGALRTGLSAVSGIPKGALDTVHERGLTKEANPEDALKIARQGVRRLRTDLSAMWKSKVDEIIQTFDEQTVLKNGKKVVVPPTRMGLNEKQSSELFKVIDEFGVDEDLIPQNLQDMSAKESLNLMKALNEVDSKAAILSPKGAILRRLKGELKKRVISNFGGEEGPIAGLWKEYSSKKGVHDEVDNIVRAYVRNKPISDVTAKNRLMAAFDDNKSEYIKAIKSLEDEIGVDILGPAASAKFRDIIPAGVTKADGGLPTADAFTKMVRLLMLPLTSPRAVGKLSAPSGESGAISKRLFGSQEGLQPASTKQMPIQTSNSVQTIPATVAQPAKSSSVPKNAAYGGAAGFEQDDEGNITFNPEKAAIGMVGIAGMTRSQAVNQIARRMDGNSIEELARFVQSQKQKLFKTNAKGVLEFPNAEVKNAFDDGMRYINYNKETQARLSNATLTKIATFFDDIIKASSSRR